MSGSYSNSDDELPPWEIYCEEDEIKQIEQSEIINRMLVFDRGESFEVLPKSKLSKSYHHEIDFFPVFFYEDEFIGGFPEMREFCTEAICKLKRITAKNNRLVNIEVKRHMKDQISTKYLSKSKDNSNKYTVYIYANENDKAANQEEQLCEYYFLDVVRRNITKYSNDFKFVKANLVTFKNGQIIEEPLNKSLDEIGPVLLFRGDIFAESITYHPTFMKELTERAKKLNAKKIAEKNANLSAYSSSVSGYYSD